MPINDLVIDTDNNVQGEKERKGMTFEVGHTYYDTVGRRWKIIKWRIVGDGYTVFIVKRRFKTEIAV